MLILLALPAIFAVAALHRCLAMYAPTNMLVRSVRTQQPRWRTVLMLAGLAAALLAAMHVVADAVASGAPGWLNLVLLVVASDAIKIGLLAAAAAGRLWLQSVKGVLRAA